jgi:hypothetical protein
MTRGELKIIYQRLSYPNSLAACGQVLDMYADVIYRMINKLGGKKSSDIIAYEGFMLLQMMWTKSLHLNVAIQGVTFTDANGLRTEVLDPIVLAGQVRTIYETSCMFHIVYRRPKTKDEKLILYKLWVYSGLAYRQNMLHAGTGPEGLEKSAEERIQMDQLVNEIKETELYTTLDATGKKMIETRLGSKAFLITFEEDNKIKTYNWFNAAKAMNAREGTFEKIYNYFSQYAHPTNVSVFQFSDMFAQRTMDNISVSILNTNIGCMFLSTFVVDFLTLYPETMEIFNSLPVINQLVINTQNIMTRGVDYSITDLGLHTLGRIADDESVVVTTEDGYRLDSMN